MNSRKTFQRALIAAVALATTAAWGHPNHAEQGANTTLLHLLTEPDHLLVLLAAVGVGIWAVRRGRNARRKD